VDKNTLDDLASRLADAVPNDIENLAQLRGDMEQNFRALLSDLLDRLELVTREEFDVQRKVLERTREKLDALERELVALQSDSGAD